MSLILVVTAGSLQRNTITINPAHRRQRQQHPQLPILVRVKHAVLDAGGHQFAGLGVGHAVAAGREPFLGRTHLRVGHVLTAAGGGPGFLDDCCVHKVVHH